MRAAYALPCPCTSPALSIETQHAWCMRPVHRSPCPLKRPPLYNDKSCTSMWSTTPDFDHRYPPRLRLPVTQHNQAFGCRVDFSAREHGGNRIVRESQLAFGAIIQGSSSLLRCWSAAATGVLSHAAQPYTQSYCMRH